jgi:hypothetical protein
LRGGLALFLRIRRAIGNRRAKPQRGRKVARQARAGTIGIAARALCAVPGLAFLGKAALGTQRLEPARGIDAEIPRHALAVVGTSDVAARSIAGEGIALYRERRDTIAGLVAGRRRGVRASLTDFRGTNRARRVFLASPVSVAQASRPTQRLAAVLAGLARVYSTGGDVHAMARRSGQGAASAGTFAGAFAAHTVHTLIRFAVACGRARLAILLLSTAAGGQATNRRGDTLMSGLAISVRRTRAIAVASRAKVGRTIHQLRCPAGALPIAHTRRIEENVARARGRAAGGILREDRTGPDAVAKPRGSAGGGTVDHACAMGKALIDEVTPADGARLVARQACPVAGHVAALVIRAVTGSTVAIGIAVEAV